MFQMKDEMQTAVKHNIRGGEGSPSFRYLFSAEQLGGRAEMMAVISLQPGESVGVHPHETNGDRHRGRREPRAARRRRGILRRRPYPLHPQPHRRPHPLPRCDRPEQVSKRLIAAADSLLRRSLHCFHRYDRIGTKHL